MVVADGLGAIAVAMDEPPSKKDSIPWDEHHPSDSGCIFEGVVVSTSCLNCPVPQCRYDDPQGFKIWAAAKRAEWKAQREAGKPVETDVQRQKREAAARLRMLAMKARLPSEDNPRLLRKFEKLQDCLALESGPWYVTDLNKACGAGNSDILSWVLALGLRVDSVLNQRGKISFVITKPVREATQLSLLAA